MFRLIIPFIIGIVAALSVEKPVTVHWSIFAALIAAHILLTHFSKKILSFRFRWITGLLIYVFLILAGFELTNLNTAKYKKNHYSLSNEKINRVIVRICDSPVEKEKSIKVVARVLMVKDSVAWHHSTGKVLLYFEKDTSAHSLKYGDDLLLSTHVNPLAPPQNPHQFDFRKYLSNNGIYSQAYIKQGNWLLLSEGNGNPLIRFSNELRKTLLNTLIKNGISGNEFAVASAILLGYDENLDKDLRKSYAGAGALHILCVSGLHVGIIFIILNNFILLFFDKLRHGKIPKAIILLIAIWFYAMITGFSPSVLRASLMFSLFIFRNLIKAPPNIWNTVAFSAFILLVINPYIITKIGFQLSYAAVIGIIAVQPHLYKLIVFNNWVGDKIWAIITVSIAAQIGVFPISLYYFHQFPVYFIFTNIVVIPLSWLIIFLGLAVLATSGWQLISHVLAFLLKYLLMAMNISVSFIEKLPYSKIEGLVLNVPEVILIFSIIILFSSFLLQKQGKYLFYSLIFSTLLSGSFLVRKIQNHNRHELVVYSINNKTAIDFTEGEKVLFLADSTIASKSKEYDYNIKNNRIFKGIKEEILCCADSINLSIPNDKFNFLKYFPENYFQFRNKRIGIIDKKYVPVIAGSKLKLDYLIITGNPNIKISDLLNIYDPGLIIFDGSNNYYKIKRWTKECLEKNIKFYNVKDEGAFITQLAAIKGEILINRESQYFLKE